MKKLINKIPDKYYLISMAFILFIMVLGRYMFPDLMNKGDMVSDRYMFPDLMNKEDMVSDRYMFPDIMKKWDMVIYFLPQLFLPFTIIFILYFYIKDNHSKKIVDKLYLFKLTQTEDNELLVVDNKKILSIFILYMLLWPIQLHVIGMYFLPALLYLTLINMPSQYKIHIRYIYLYKHLNIIFLLFFVLNIFLPPELYFISFNLSSIYFIVLYVYFLLIVIFLIYLKLKLERNFIYLISSISICFMVIFVAPGPNYYWFIIFMLGFMMPYYTNYIKSIVLTMALTIVLVYLIKPVHSFLPSATPHIYLWNNSDKCMITYPARGSYLTLRFQSTIFGWTGGDMKTKKCKDILRDWH